MEDLIHRIGPFPNRDLETIESLLKERGVGYQVIAGQEQLAQAEEELKLNPLAYNAVRLKSFDPSWIFFEINESELKKIEDKFEVLGINLNRDPALEALVDQEEYLCPKCKHSQNEAGFCPEHKVQLLKWADWIEAKKFTPGAPSGPFVYLIVVAFLAAAYWFYKSYGHS